MCFLGAELIAANALWAGSSAVTVGQALGAASAALGAIGTFQQGQAQAQASQYNARVAEQNATAARQKAAFDEQLRREQLERVQAAARAAIGKSGSDFSGSALDLMAQNAAQAELDALAIRYGGEVRAAGQENQAQLDRAQASQARTGGYFGAGAKLLQGAFMLTPRPST
jgi:hypothetical protein